MIRTLLYLAYGVLFAATAIFALSAIMILLLAYFTGIGIGTVVVALVLLALSFGSCVLYECISIFLDD